MIVCDICWNPSPEFKGSPIMSAIDRTSQSMHVFGRGVDANMDMCRSCLKLFQDRDWQGLAERSQSVLLKRLES